MGEAVKLLSRLRRLVPVFVWGGDVRETAAQLKAGAPIHWYGVAFGRVGFGMLHVGEVPTAEKPAP